LIAHAEWKPRLAGTGKHIEITQIPAASKRDIHGQKDLGV
jgi:hypothetical protein